MYPFIRLTYQFFLHRNSPPMSPLETHISQHRCWPWDLDMFMELNNGRTLTIFDLGRIPAAKRAGLMAALKREKWGMTMAGASVRYRARIRLFQKIEMRSRLVGWDTRFFYLEQSMWRGATCCNQIVYRAAITDKIGIVPAARLMEALGMDATSPAMPAWVQAWIDAENTRPWPPKQDADDQELDAPLRKTG